MKILDKSKILTLLAVLGISGSVCAQTPLSGFMQGKKGGNISFSLNHENYSEVYLIPEKIDGVPVFNSVSVNSFNIYGSYGFTDKLDLIVNLPFVRTVGSGNQEVLNDLGFQNSREGAQDISAFLKYELAKKGNLSLQGSLGVTTPISDYNVNEGLQSIIAIGNRATTFNAVALAHYKLSSGFFVTGQAGYSLRSTEVPDAVLSQLKLGWAKKRFYADAYLANQTSTGGVDILRPGFNGFFPATQVNYTRIGANVYAPLDGNFGINAGGGTTIGGRNLGKADFFSFGFVYNFKYREY
ncbi:hypothetical protein [Pedobacter glucosidilyticus]|uniref:hypothetical protein n=1 Tax=Pedobacter glucosidilyticus TaxID=1122941 RepID=UPI0026ED4221|nr:hypothetical protein [Pedobacter glucosidilyticus]